MVYRQILSGGPVVGHNIRRACDLSSCAQRYFTRTRLPLGHFRDITKEITFLQLLGLRKVIFLLSFCYLFIFLKLSQSYLTGQELSSKLSSKLSHWSRVIFSVISKVIPLVKSYLFCYLKGYPTGQELPFLLS